MKRKDFLKGLGVAGVGSLFLQSGASGSSCKKSPAPPSACTLIPSETAGPYPLDLSDNNFYFRQDVREDRTGVQLNLKMKIIGIENCQPMPNLRVNIWHCDKDGNYSGYQTEVGKTYLRGYQFTNFNGETEFVTIFPGWYNGRICHIHFQVFVSSVYAAISQLTFPVETKNAIYAANPTLYTKGADGTTSINSDMIFSDGYALQLATLTPNATTGGYDSYLEAAIAGTGVSALRELEPETGGQFKLRPNYPNPFSDTTTIPFTLNNAAQVKLELFDLNGKQILELANEKMSDGEHEILLRRNANGVELTPGGYVFRLAVENGNGRFSQSKMLTVN